MHCAARSAFFVCSLFDFENDFADVFAALEDPVGFLCLGDRQDLVNGGFDLPRLDLRPDVADKLGKEHRLKLGRFGAKRAADQTDVEFVEFF